MSNPITGAYLEAQDKKTGHKVNDDESSKKMGLEVIGSTAQAFAAALIDSAVQTPVNGIAQLFNWKEARALKLVDNKQQELNSAEWYGQLAGTGVGSLLNYIVLSKGLKAGGEYVKFAGSASTSKVWRPLANTISLAENSVFFKTPLRAAAATGALYGGVLTPVNPEGDNMCIARAKNAAIGAASVAAMIAPNQIRLSNNAFKAGQTGSKFTEAVALTLGGPLAGLVHAEGRALAQGKLAPDIDGRDFKESLLAYSILGAGFAAYRGMSTVEKPMEVKEYESTDKLIATRRPEVVEPRRTREEVGQFTKEWNGLVKDFDKFVRETIYAKDISKESKLRITLEYRRGYNELQSDPANIGKFEPYDKLWETTDHSLQVAAEEQALANSLTQQALDRWNKAHPNTPAQLGDLVAPMKTSSQQNPQLPATLEQAQQRNNELATPEQLNKGHDQVPAIDGESMNWNILPKPQPNPIDDLQPKATGLQSGFLGRRMQDMNQAMSNPNSPYYAKRANINTPQQSEGKQHDLAKTLSPKLKNTTFAQFGYTTEQGKRQALVKEITSTSEDTAKGIGSPEELHKHKPEPWDTREEK